MWQSSNPALRNDNAFNEVYGRFAERADTITLQGVVNRTGLLVLIAVAAGGGGYALVGTMPSILWISCIAAFIVSLGVYFVIHGKPALAPVLAPLYAIV
ncbi:MAG: Bax inhibitor-1/YccA family membrane protein, partial [Planctomycetota bacterium]